MNASGTAPEFFGYTLAGGSNISGTGASDLVVGAPNWNTLVGAAYVYDGTGNATYNPGARWTMRAATTQQEQFSVSLDIVGDLTNDNIDALEFSDCVGGGGGAPEEGFFFVFPVGGPDININVGGDDAEDGLTSFFTIVDLPDDGQIFADKDGDGDLDLLAVGDTLVDDGTGGLTDFVLYFTEVAPEDSQDSFQYTTTDSDGLVSDPATIIINFPVLEVDFGITVISEDTEDDSPTQAATIHEEDVGDGEGDPGDNTATFTIALGGAALTGAFEASFTVSIDPASTAEDPDFTADVIQRSPTRPPRLASA